MGLVDERFSSLSEDDEEEEEEEADEVDEDTAAAEVDEDAAEVPDLPEDAADDKREEMALIFSSSIFRMGSLCLTSLLAAAVDVLACDTSCFSC